MSDIRYVVGTSSKGKTNTDDAFLAVQGTKDGAIYAADWVFSKALEGKIFVAQSGTGTSPTTFNATYSAAEPDLYVYVPSGTNIIPIYVSVCFEDTGTAQVMDVMAVASSTGDSAVTGTALTVYPLRTDAPSATVCTATGVVTAAGTSPLAGYYYEFWRPYAGFGEDAFNSSTGWVNSGIHGASWSLRQSGIPPIITGGGSLSVYASGQAATGFITVMWVEETQTYLV